MIRCSYCGSRNPFHDRVYCHHLKEIDERIEEVRTILDYQVEILELIRTRLQKELNSVG